MKTKSTSSPIALILWAAGWLLLIGILFWAERSRGDLTAVVTPGYQFPVDGSQPTTYQLLNELGQPTIAIFGSVGGSNSVTPGSITTLAFAPSVFDGYTIGLDSGSPPSARVLTAGIVSKGLMSINTTNLQLYIDTNYFLLSTNSTLDTNYNTGSSSMFWLTAAPQAYAALTNSGSVSLPSGTLPWVPVSSSALVMPHYLSNAPAYLRVVLVQATASQLDGYNPNDEIDIQSLYQGGGNNSLLFTVTADRTNITVSRSGSTSGLITPKTGGGAATINSPETTFKVKFYAR